MKYRKLNSLAVAAAVNSAVLLFAASCNPLAGTESLPSNHHPGISDESIVSTDLSTIRVSPTTVAADGVTNSQVKIILRDAANALVTGKTVSLVSNRGSADVITPLSPITDTTGTALFSVKSNSLGHSQLTASVVGDAVTLSKKSQIFFLSETPYTDWRPSLATGTSPGSNLPPIAQIIDLTSSTINTGFFQNFAFSAASSGWAGNGSAVGLTPATGPYRIVLDGLASFVNFGIGLNSSSDFSLEAWALPLSVAAKGTVIFSNGDGVGRGVTVKQDWSGTGSLRIGLGSTAYIDEVFSDLPNSYWRLGESAGPAAHDLMGAHDGTYLAGCTLNQSGALAGDADAAIALDGSGGHLDMGTFPGPSAGTSLEAWVNFSTLNPAQVITSQYNDNARQAYTQLAVLADGSLFFRIFEGDTRLDWIGRTSAAAAITTSQWYHVVGTWDGGLTNSSIKIYINGVRVDAADDGNGTFASANSNPVHFWIGAQEYGATPDAPLNGKVDEVAYYGFPLSAARIIAHYQAKARPTCVSQTSLTNQTWSLITVSFASASSLLSLYLDDIAQCSIAVSGTQFTGSASPFLAGAITDTLGTPLPNRYWRGGLGELRTYQRVLSSGDVVQDFTTTRVDY